MKKTIALILTVVMLIASFPMMLVSAEGDPTPYSGTPDTSWLTAEVEAAQAFTITTAEQLAGFATLVTNGNNFYGYKIKLGADIVINDWTKEELSAYATNGTIPTGKTEPKTWNPIGGEARAFEGVFDGQGHTISGMYFNDKTKNNIGLFGLVSGGSVQYLQIKDAYFHGQTNVASVVSFISNVGATVSGVYCDAIIIAEEKYGGGVVGAFYTGDCTIKDCVLSETSSVTTVANQYAGGMVGGFQGKSNITIKNCANYGTITGFKKPGGMTGIIQKNSNIIFDTCINAGKITASKEANTVGNIAGAFYADSNGPSGTITFKDCVYVAGMAANDVAYKNLNTEASKGNVNFVYKITNASGEVVLDENPGKLINTVDELKGQTSSLTAAFSTWYFEDGKLPVPNGVAIAMGKASLPINRAVSSQASVAKDGKYNIRFIATIDKFEYEAYGFEITYTVPEASEPTVVKSTEKTIYTELSGVTKEFDILSKRAADHSSNYLYTTIISDLPATGTIEFTVKPYTKTAGVETYGIGYVVTYTDGAFVSAQSIS